MIYFNHYFIVRGHNSGVLNNEEVFVVMYTDGQLVVHYYTAQ